MHVGLNHLPFPDDQCYQTCFHVILVIYASSKKFFCSSENIHRNFDIDLLIELKMQTASWLLECIVKLKLSTKKNPEDNIAFKSVDK